MRQWSCKCPHHVHFGSLQDRIYPASASLPLEPTTALLWAQEVLHSAHRKSPSCLRSFLKIHAKLSAWTSLLVWPSLHLTPKLWNPLILSVEKSFALLKTCVFWDETDMTRLCTTYLPLMLAMANRNAIMFLNFVARLLSFTAARPKSLFVLRNCSNSSSVSSSRSATARRRNKRR